MSEEKSNQPSAASGQEEWAQNRRTIMVEIDRMTLEALRYVCKQWGKEIINNEDLIGKLRKENEELKDKLQASEKMRKEAIQNIKELLGEE